MRTITIAQSVLQGVEYNGDIQKAPLTKTLYNTLQLIENGFRYGDPICLKLLTNNRPRKRGYDGTFKSGKNKIHVTTIRFPSMDEKENLKFVRYVKVFQILYENLKSEKGVITKRQIYYKDVSLFERQAVADQCLNAICQSLNITSESIGVVASPKGLIYGNLKYTYRGELRQLSTRDGICLTPLISLNSKLSDFTFDHEEPPPIQIIVVEKEAIFRRLCERPELQNCIIMTAKGFPDMLTRVFLYILAHSFPYVPVVGYVDSDIYGLMIFDTYKSYPSVDLTTIVKTQDIMEQWEPACDRLLYGGVHLLGNGEKGLMNNFGSDLVTHYLPIKVKDFKTGSGFLNRILKRQLEHPSDRDGCTEDTDSVTKDLVREAQLGMLLMVKREMQETD